MEARLLKFEEDNGFKDFKYSGEDVITLSEEIMTSLDGLTAEMCYECAVKLNFYNLYLQKLVNQDTARTRFITSLIRRQVSTRLGNYTGSFEQKEAAAIKDDDYSREMDKKRAMYQMRLDRLSYLGPRIEGFAKSLQDLAKYKEKNRD